MFCEHTETVTHGQCHIPSPLTIRQREVKGYQQEIICSTGIFIFATGGVLHLPSIKTSFHQESLFSTTSEYILQNVSADREREQDDYAVKKHQLTIP